MRIGVPKEIKTHEYRVGMTPAGVREAGSHAVFAEGARSILQRQRRDLGDLERLSDEHGTDLLLKTG